MPAAATNHAPALRSPMLVTVLAWFLPGSGHFLLGRRGRGAIVLAAVLVAFIVGLLMRGSMFEAAQGGDVISRLIQLGGRLGDWAVGLPYFLATWLGYAAPDVATHTADYGSKFIVCAGLLNILAMVDAYEIATGKKD